MTVGPSEAEPFWTDFLRGLVRRGLTGFKLIRSLSLAFGLRDLIL